MAADSTLIDPEPVPEPEHEPDVEAQIYARIGSVIRGKWRIDSVLGIGGMAAVYAATHRNGHKCAIKMLLPTFSAHKEVIQRFLKEGYVANEVNHPGAVAVLDDDVTDDGSHFLVMDFLAGETFDSVVRAHPEGLDPAMAMRVAHDLLDVLEAAHNRGIVHRDIKPENVFILRDGRVKLLDFGIAHLRQTSVAAGPARTQLGVVMGTPSYMPPEQARGQWDRVDAQSDVWAVGAVMFVALSGKPLRDAPTVNMELAQAMVEPAPPLQSVAPAIPAALAAVVDRALLFEKSARWSSAREMQEALGALLAAPAPATPPGVAARLSEEVEPSPTAADPGPAQPPEPTAVGLLSERPLAHLLMFALDRKLSGSFEIADDPSQYGLIVVAEGKIARVWTSEPVVFLGHVLYEAGVLDAGQLGASLAKIAQTKALHGQSLLAEGLITVEQLALGLRTQRLRKLHHIFTFPASSRFAFYADVDLIGERPDDVEPLEPLGPIWRGIAANPSADHVRATLAAIGGRPIRFVGSLDPGGFRDVERATIESLRSSPATVAELATRPGWDARAAELLAYFLVLTKLAVPVDGMPMASAPSSKGGGAVPGLNPARPSMAPSLAIPAPPAATPNDQHEEPHAAVHEALKGAEMLFIAGERQEALTAVRDALTAVPKIPYGLVLLAALEASNVRRGQEQKLRDIIRRLDGIIEANPKVRHGRFYRARLQKRLGDLGAAIADLRRAAVDDPDDLDVLNELEACERKEAEPPPTPASGGSMLDRLLRKL